MVFRFVFLVFLVFWCIFQRWEERCGLSEGGGATPIIPSIHSLFTPLAFLFYPLFDDFC